MFSFLAPTIHFRCRKPYNKRVLPHKHQSPRPCCKLHPYHLLHPTMRPVQCKHIAKTRAAHFPVRALGQKSGVRTVSLQSKFNSGNTSPKSRTPIRSDLRNSTFMIRGGKPPRAATWGVRLDVVSPIGKPIGGTIKRH